MDCECPICFAPGGMVTLQCGHRVHAGCVAEWFSINASCPVCRRGVLNYDCAGLVTLSAGDAYDRDAGGHARSTALEVLRSVNSTLPDCKAVFLKDGLLLAWAVPQRFYFARCDHLLRLFDISDRVIGRCLVLLCECSANGAPLQPTSVAQISIVLVEHALCEQFMCHFMLMMQNHARHG